MLQMLQTIKTRKRLLAAAAALAVAGLAAAPARAQFQQGDTELRVSGFAQNDVNFSGIIINVGGQLGYFVSDQFEAGVRQDLNFSDLGGNNLSGSSSVFVNYHFGDRGAQFQPFIGANIGYIYGDAVNDTFVAGPEIGIKYFLNDAWFLYGSVEYEFFFDNASNANDSFNDGTFNYRLGIGVLLGK